MATVFKPGQLSQQEALALTQLSRDVDFVKRLRVAAPLRLRRDSAGMVIETIEVPDEPESGSGGGGGGDLTTVIIGPYLTDVSIECVTGSGGDRQIRLTKTWGISILTGMELTVVQQVYVPESGGG